MTTRRNVPVEKLVAESQGGPPATSIASDVRPVVPTSVILKLLIFTAAMIVVPIGSYFVTLNSVFRGNATFAGGFAAVMANVVLVGYIIVAMKEDASDRLEAEQNQKKAQ